MNAVVAEELGSGDYAKGLAEAVGAGGCQAQALVTLLEHGRGELDALSVIPAAFHGRGGEGLDVVEEAYRVGFADREGLRGGDDR